MQIKKSRALRLIQLVVIGSIASCVNAQVGPNPSDIPQRLVPQSQQAQDAAQAGQSPSTSASIRSTIDDILIANAAEPSPDSVVESDSGSTGLVRDTHTGLGSKPIGQPATRTTLIGASESNEGFAFVDQGYLQTMVALGGVLLLILGLGQVYKRLARSQGGLAGQLGAGGSAPSGIIEVIGRYPISKGMTLVVLKFDRRVLLLSHGASSKGKGGKSASMEVLCELTDPEDIASILLKSRSAEGNSIAQSFEQSLREADDLTDDHLRQTEIGYSEVNPVRFPTQRTQPVRTITTDEGDRAELWSSGQDSRAAAGVLRKRLASMRREQQL